MNWKPIQEFDKTQDRIEFLFFCDKQYYVAVCEDGEFVCYGTHDCDYINPTHFCELKPPTK